MIYIQKTIKLNDNLQELYLMYLKLNSIVIQNIKKNMKHYTWMEWKLILNFKIELNIFCLHFINHIMITFKNEYGIKYSVISFDELLKFIDYDFIYEINCSNNNLTQLPILPLYLVKLDCSDNNLIELPKLPPLLEYLHCNNNKLSSLPEIPKNLGWLYTADNNLSEIPVMPLSLRILECSNNSITNILHIPENMKYMYINSNFLTDLPYLPDQLHYLDFNNNPIKLFIDNYFDGSKILYLEWKQKNETIFANKLGNWFLECKYNPKYKYCRDRVNSEYDNDVIQIKT